MTSYYKLRTDISDVPSDKIIELVKKYSECYAYAFEGIDTVNPHMHFYLETMTKNQTLRAALRKLKLTGNGKYSLKETEKNPIQYLAYLTKEGKYEFVNIPVEVVKQAEEYDAQVKLELKEKKENKKRVLDHLIEYVDKNFDTIKLKSSSGVSWLDKNKVIIIRLVVKYHLEKNILIRKFQIKAYVDTIMFKRYPDQFDELCDLMML